MSKLTLSRPPPKSPALDRVLAATWTAPPVKAPPVAAVETSNPAAKPAKAERISAFVHVPADPKTRAWNRAREAQWHATPAAIETALRKLCPAVFRDPPVPLAIGIRTAVCDLLAREFEPGDVARFMRTWTKRPAYWSVLVAGAGRFDLSGVPVGTVTATEIGHPVRGAATKLQNDDDGITEKDPDRK